MSLADLNGNFTIDPAHTTISWVARHAMVTKVRGSFTEFEGTASGNGADPSSVAINLTIQTASIDTRNAGRDEHLRSADFFDVETYPTITFASTGAQIDGDTLTVTGDLTIKDVTKSITIPFEFDGEAKDPFGNDRVGFEGKVAVSRKDWGLTWNAALETGGVLVSDKVTLEFEVSAIKNA